MAKNRHKRRQAARAHIAAQTTAPRYTGSNLSCGDRVMVKHGRLSRTENVLFGGRCGVVTSLSREHDMLMATVLLDRSASVRRRISVRKHIGELQFIEPGMTRAPAKQHSQLPEHQTVYGSVFG